MLRIILSLDLLILSAGNVEVSQWHLVLAVVGRSTTSIPRVTADKVLGLVDPACVLGVSPDSVPFDWGFMSSQAVATRFYTSLLFAVPSLRLTFEDEGPSPWR
ncbi:hypothetical protein BD309DRAFT_961742 [Dichomitus squalens]|nr:hypothetical protein BD309DRAFT_961742 [Dichomitus squalens]